MASALLALIVTLSQATYVASVIVDQSSPTWSASITFTEIYPQDAARQSRQPQYPNQPQTQVDCYQTFQQADGSYITYDVAEVHTNVTSKTKIASGWWQGETYPVTLTDGLSPQADVTKSATCGAILYSFDVQNQPHVWASSQFTVNP